MEEIYVVIPAYRPDRSLPEKAREIRDVIPGRILVVDDGSGPEYRDVFQRAGAPEYCEVLLHRENLGKGAALKTGFERAAERIAAERAGRDPDTKSPARILCLDCEGQHLPEDGLRLLGKAKENPGALVLGVRDFSGDQVPWKSRAGNRISSALFRLFGGGVLSDTQTGFRAFDERLLGVMRSVPGDRFEYETRVLFECVRRGIPILTEPVETVYIGRNEGTHFRAFRDGARVAGAFLSARGGGRRRSG